MLVLHDVCIAASFRTVIHLMGAQIVERREFDSAGSANHLLVQTGRMLRIRGARFPSVLLRWRRLRGLDVRRLLRARLGHRVTIIQRLFLMRFFRHWRFGMLLMTSRAIMFLMRQIVFVFTKHNVALFALGDALLYDDLCTIVAAIVMDNITGCLLNL